MPVAMSCKKVPRFTAAMMICMASGFLASVCFAIIVGQRLFLSSSTHLDRVACGITFVAEVIIASGTFITMVDMVKIEVARQRRSVDRAVEMYVSSEEEAGMPLLSTETRFV